MNVLVDRRAQPWLVLVRLVRATPFSRRTRTRSRLTCSGLWVCGGRARVDTLVANRPDANNIKFD